MKSSSVFLFHFGLLELLYGKQSPNALCKGQYSFVFSIWILFPTYNDSGRCKSLCQMSALLLFMFLHHHHRHHNIVIMSQLHNNTFQLIEFAVMTLHNIYHCVNQDVAKISPSLFLTIILIKNIHLSVAVQTFEVSAKKRLRLLLKQYEVGS